MNLIAFVTGMGAVSLLGWLVVGLAQYRSPVLTAKERFVWSVVLGPTLSMFTVFVSHVAGLTNLDLLGFAVPMGIATAILGVLAWKTGTWRTNAAEASVTVQGGNPPRKWIRIALLVLVLWTAVKVLAGAYDLVRTPTYWDDSFNNWNMRGKIFYVQQELVLEIPAGNGFIQTAQGVGSYPPMLSLMKTWLSVVRGEWSDGLVNSIHTVWFLGLIAAFYLLLRRFADAWISGFGVYLLVSLPMLLIQGSNPYADVFVAAHVFLGVASLLGLHSAKSSGEITSWAKLFFLTLGLLILTKNEALLLHAPLLVLAAGWVAYDLTKKGVLRLREHRTTAMAGLGVLLALVLPWLAFKWFHGLTFGNAKSVSGNSPTLNPNVLRAIWFHFTHEPNWMFLPLALVLGFVYRGRSGWRLPVGMLRAFVILGVLAQFFLFLTVPALATEAIMQTGLSRGLLQIAPVAMLLLILLVADKQEKETVGSLRQALERKR